MKSMTKRLSQLGFTALLILILSSFSSIDKKEKEGEINIKSASGQLEKAIEERKFGDAKDVVNKIIPWMKLDIKNDKKTLSQIGKSIDASEMDKKDFSVALKKKNKLYESTKHLVETSPAAIRVKGKDLVKLVNEYASLTE